MTAVEKLKQWILYRSCGERYETVDEVNEYFNDVDHDVLSECRYGEVETGLPGEYSRHYESCGVAARMLDGSWVGWTKWYGGGKHGEPESIDWVSDAYPVEMTEETRVVKVFQRKGA